MTRRGILIFGIVAAILVGGAWLLALRHRYEPSSTSDGGASDSGGGDDARGRSDGPSGPFVGNDSNECWKLRRKYFDLWQQSTVCSADAECVVEKREPLAAGLYDCYRYSNRSLSHVEADRVSREWQTLGCADALTIATREVCPPLPAVHCQKGRCIERPQPPIPVDWKRFYVDHAFRIFLPPDFEHLRSDNLEAPLAQFLGDGRYLEIALTNRGGPLTKSNAADGSMTLFVGEDPILIDGHPSTLFRTKDSYDRGDSGQPATWSMAEIVDVGAAGLGYNSYRAGTSTNLRFTMSCDNAQRCEPMRLILEQADILVVVNAPKRD